MGVANSMVGILVILIPCLTIINGLPSEVSSPTEDVSREEPADISPEKPQICEDIFSLNGLNYSTFYLGASHGLHSLSLEEIRYYFDENAPENNKIPTVNIDFRSEKVLHFNAPIWGYEERFSTWALKIMDWFMINDRPHLYETGSTTLQKIGHQYHMQELYSRASEIYKELRENPPRADVCTCVNDVNANGILSELATISNALKYRGRLSERGDDSTHDEKDVTTDHSRIERETVSTSLARKARQYHNNGYYRLDRPPKLSRKTRDAFPISKSMKNAEDYRRNKGFYLYNSSRGRKTRDAFPISKSMKTVEDYRRNKGFYLYNSSRGRTQRDTSHIPKSKKNAEDYRRNSGTYLFNFSPPKGRAKRETIDIKTITELQNNFLRNSTQETAEKLIFTDDWIPGKLNGRRDWITYSAMLYHAMPNEEGLHDFATLIYCKLNYPSLDHPADLF